MHVSITTNRIKYSLEFSGKFNFILGNSGTKKTLLLTSLLKWKRKIRRVQCKIEDATGTIDRNCVHVLTNSVLIEGDYHNIFNTVGDVYFIDENCSVLHERDIARVLVESKNYFIIISRSVAGWLPVSVDSVFQLNSRRGTLYNEPIYCNKNSDLTQIKSIINHISTEDSASSLLVLKHLFSNYHLTFGKTREIINGKQVSRDNSQLCDIVKQELNSGITGLLVVFDAAAFGAFYDNLLAIMHNQGDNISILAWESFEWFVLGAKPWCINLTKEDAGYNYNSVEQMSSEKLASLINYGKGRLSLPECLLSLNHRCSYQCTLGRNSSTQFKLENLLYGPLAQIAKHLLPAEENKLVKKIDLF